MCDKFEVLHVFMAVTERWWTRRPAEVPNAQHAQPFRPEAAGMHVMDPE